MKVKLMVRMLRCFSLASLSNLPYFIDYSVHFFTLKRCWNISSAL